MSWRRFLQLLVVVLVAATGSACGRYVGPARTYGTFEHKAAATAEAALSAVATVRLLAETAAAGHSFAPYTGVALAEQEDDLTSVRTTFASIQPPDDRSDALRVELMELLDRTVDDVAAVRIASRRGEVGGLGVVAAPLAADEEALTGFAEAHR